MGQIIEQLRRKAVAGDTNATALLELSTPALLRERERAVSPPAKKSADMAVLITAMATRVKKLARGRLTDVLIRGLSADAVAEGWLSDRLNKEVERAVRVHEKQKMTDHLLERDRALAAIAVLRKHSDGSRFIRERDPMKASEVGWSLCQLMGDLSTPSKLVSVASKLGYTRERCGRVGDYLRWRLGSSYTFGTEARSVDEIKELRRAAREVLALRK